MKLKIVLIGHKESIQVATFIECYICTRSQSFNSI